MKKLITLLTASGLVFPSAVQTIACSSKEPPSQTGPVTNPSRPSSQLPDLQYSLQNVDKDTLINNDIHDFFAARAYFKTKYSLELDQFTMYWSSTTTVRFVPMPGTSARNNLKELTDYTLDSGYNSVSTNQSLSTLGDNSPLTDLSVSIPYIASLKDASVSDLAWYYFNVLEYMTGKKIDTSAYLYSYQAATATTDDANLKGILTVVNRKNDQDNVSINVDKNTIALDEFLDTKDVYDVYLPQAMVDVTGSDFNINGATKKAGPFQAFLNYYLATSNYANEFFSYYQDDLVDILSKLTSTTNNNNPYVTITNNQDTSADGKGVLNVKIQKPSNDISSESGIFAADGDNNWYDFNIHYTTILPDDSTVHSYNYFTEHILQQKTATNIKGAETDTGVWESDGVNLKTTVPPVAGINDLTNTTAARTKWATNVVGIQYALEYEFANFKLNANDLKDTLTIKQAFIEKLGKITKTDFKLDRDIYLDDEISLVRSQGKYYLAPKFGSRLSQNFQRSSMTKNALGIINIPLVYATQPTASSYVFQLSA